MAKQANLIYYKFNSCLRIPNKRLSHFLPVITGMNNGKCDASARSDQDLGIPPCQQLFKSARVIISSLESMGEG